MLLDIKHILSNNIINFFKWFGYTLLHIAVEKNFVEIVKFLLDNDADVNVATRVIFIIFVFVYYLSVLQRFL
jgi:ankyrin repeat protein